MYERGDIVLVPFPFTDLSSTKTRPAVVISTREFGKETGNLTVAMITSTRYSTPYDTEVRDWKEANLLSPSWIRMKFATIEPKLIRYHPGRLTKTDLDEVDTCIRRALGL